MSTLEELLPELAGVFAAQESATESIVSMLTTQIAQLIQENDRQSSRVASLEDSQLQLQDALLMMRKSYDSLEDQRQQEYADSTQTVDALVASVGHLQDKVEQEMSAIGSKYESIVSQLEAGAFEAHVAGLLSEHVTSVENKLAAHMEGRLLEMSNRSYLQAQQSEEAMKTTLELLEKKFDYLSRVKMEIKDLGKKVEKQDQTLDDMRMGMELLAKSIGTDEDDESDGDNADHGDDTGDSVSHKPLRQRVDKSDVLNVMKRISLSSADIQAKIDKNAATLSAAAVAPLEPIERPLPGSQPARPVIKRSKSLSAAVNQQAQFSRSKTVGGIGALSSAPFSSLSTHEPPADTSDTSTEPHMHTAEDEEHIADDLPPPASPSDGVGDTTDAVVTETATSPPEDTVDTDNPSEPLDVAAALELEPTLFSDENVAEPDDIEPAGPTAGLEPSLERDYLDTDTVLDPRPPLAQEPSPEEADDAALEEAEESDHVVDILPSQTSRSRLTSRDLLQQPFEEPTEAKGFQTPTGSAMHHMSSAPNLTTAYPAVGTASTAMIRSRRMTRLQKRKSSSRVREPTDSARSEGRTPMAKDTIKELWRRMFARFVQLKRLQSLNGASPERIFRKQNLSVGARVKRLEETATDLEEMVDALESSIQLNSQNVQALGQGLGQSHARFKQLSEERVVQGQMIVGLEEKLDLIEIDLRRVRGSSRRDSSQAAAGTSVSTLMMQHQELAFQLANHVATFTTVERQVRCLCEQDLPTLASKFETAMREFRGEQELKAKELARELYQSLDRARESQSTAHARLLKRTNGFVERLYRDLMALSKAQLVALELVRSSKAQQQNASSSDVGSPSSSSSDGQKRVTLFGASVEMLHTVFAQFEDDCRAATELRANEKGGQDTQDASVLSVLLERASDFRSELSKLEEQAEKAKRSPMRAFGGDESSTNSSANFVERLELISNAQLHALEALVSATSLGDRSAPDSSDDNFDSDVDFWVQDLVVQLRSVVSLVALHAELLTPHQRLGLVLRAQDALQRDVRAHDFALAQLNTVGATVKMMNSRLDAFLELSFTFAKDEDVQHSIQDMLSSSDSVRDNLSQQLEAAHSEAQERDDVLERELVQLVARVNKKLDKDELLWTQEVIERQLQSVAKTSLGESDLVDIHRLLRNKLDKSYFNALLLEQRNLAVAVGGTGTSSGIVPGNAPLIGAKCISCSSELPPTKAMIKSVVKDQVQQEVHKSLARQQQQQQAGALVASPTSFNASTHRSMEKYKKELLAAATQPPQQQRRR